MNQVVPKLDSLTNVVKKFLGALFDLFYLVVDLEATGITRISA